jgi:hypothetical protein
LQQVINETVNGTAAVPAAAAAGGGSSCFQGKLRSRDNIKRLLCEGSVKQLFHRLCCTQHCIKTAAGPTARGCSTCRAAAAARQVNSALSCELLPLLLLMLLALLLLTAGLLCSS